MKKVLYKLLTNKYLWLIVFFLRNIIVSAHDCSSPGDCEETAGYNAAVAIVGGAVALGVGLMGAGFTTTVPEGDEEPIDESKSGTEEETVEDEEQDETGGVGDEETDDIRIEEESEDADNNEELTKKEEALAAAEAERQRKEFEEKKQLEIQKQKEVREEALQKLKEIEEEKKRRDEYIKRLCKKYKTTPDELRNVLRKNINKSQAEADAWNSYEKKLAMAEVAAKMTLVAADTAIDALANVTGPMGKGIRAGYKVVKNVGSTMATKGISGSSLASGLVTGGADAATDFIENKWVKAGTTIAGETIGGVITDGKKGMVDGFIKGTFKAGTDALTGKLAGPGYGNEMKKMIFNKDGTASITIKSGGKWITKTISGKNAINFANKKIYKQFVESGVKGASSTLKEMYIKPKLGL